MTQNVLRGKVSLIIKFAVCCTYAGDDHRYPRWKTPQGGKSYKLKAGKCHCRKSCANIVEQILLKKYGRKYSTDKKICWDRNMGLMLVSSNIGSLKSTSPQAFTIFDSDGNGEIDIGKLSLERTLSMYGAIQRPQLKKNSFRLLLLHLIYNIQFPKKFV